MVEHALGSRRRRLQAFRDQAFGRTAAPATAERSYCDHIEHEGQIHVRCCAENPHTSKHGAAGCISIPIIPGGAGDEPAPVPAIERVEVLRGPQAGASSLLGRRRRRMVPGLPPRTDPTPQDPCAPDGYTECEMSDVGEVCRCVWTRTGTATPWMRKDQAIARGIRVPPPGTRSPNRLSPSNVIALPPGSHAGVDPMPEKCYRKVGDKWVEEPCWKPTHVPTHGKPAPPPPPPPPLPGGIKILGENIKL